MNDQQKNRIRLEPGECLVSGRQPSPLGLLLVGSLCARDTKTHAIAQVRGALVSKTRVCLKTQDTHFEKTVA
jgi:hypothetical protein